MSERSYSRIPLLVLAVSLALVFYRLLLGEVFFWGLPALQFYPWRDYALDLLRQGQLPLWNPYNGAGAPLIANYQSALFYPLNWPSFFLPLASTMSITVVAHLFIAGWGMWAFTGRLGLPSLGQGVSALAFGMTSYLVARLGTYPIITAVAWFPWMMWAAFGGLSTGRWRDAGWLALFAALQFLSGHAQITWYSLVLIGAFSLWWTLVHRPLNWRNLLPVITGLFLGAGIAAIQLLPTAELLRTSQRSDGLNADFAMNYSFGPLRSLTFLSANIFGNPGDGSLVTGGAFFEDAVYIGLIPLVSACAAFFGWLAKRRNPDTVVYWRVVPFFWILVVIAFILALGRYSPVFPFLFRAIPTFDLFQAPVRWHLLTVFGLSVLAGIGTQYWLRDRAALKRARQLIVACIAVIVIAFVAPALLSLPQNAARSIQVLINGLIIAAIFGLAGGFLSLIQPSISDKRRGLWIFAVWVVVAMDMVWAAQGLNPTIAASFYDRAEFEDVPSGRGYWSAADEEQIKFKTYLLFDNYLIAVDRWQEFRRTQLPNLNLLDRVTLLNNFDPLLVGYHTQYIDLIEAHWPASSLLKAAGVSHIYTADQGQIRLDSPSPRAWFAPSICWHTDETSLQNAIGNPDWRPEQQVHLIGQGECPLLIEQTAPGEVLAIDDQANSVNIAVNTESGGMLVLADTDYPGWTAAADGEPLTIFRTNLAFRAVQVPAGAQTVYFEYRPWWLLPGILISVVALVITLALFRLRSNGIVES
jgi:hypothetical protein